jgi:hypothetical protein
MFDQDTFCLKLHYYYCLHNTAATAAVRASETRVADAMQAVRKANDERDSAIAKVVSTTYSSDATAKQTEQDNAHWREVYFIHLHCTVTNGTHALGLLLFM